MSFDTEADNRAFAEKFDFPYELLCDTDKEIALAYGACDSKDAGYPQRVSYLLDAEGRVARAWPKVNPKDHSAEVLAALDELG